MYKVFFQDRIVFLCEKAPDLKAGPEQEFSAYRNQADLRKLLEKFSHDEQIHELHIFHPDQKELSEAFASCFKPVSAGGGVVFNREGEFLVIKRNGIWDLPKGKMEEGEDFETTALREVEEETGLTALECTGLLLSTFHTYPLKGKIILKETQWFEMQWKGKGSPVLQAEEGITDYRWVRPGKSGFIRKNTYASILDVLRLKSLL